LKTKKCNLILNLDEKNITSCPSTMVSIGATGDYYANFDDVSSNVPHICDL